MKEIVKLPSYIISEQILNQTDKFTIKDIFNKVKEKINNINTDEILNMIRIKIIELCDLGLIIGNESIYYVA